MQININGINYSVIQESNKFDPSAMGRCNEKQAEIYIAKDMKPDVKSNTLLHELFHVFFRASALGEKSTEEEIVEALSNQLFSCMMHNKDFFIKMVVEEL